LTNQGNLPGLINKVSSSITASVERRRTDETSSKQARRRMEPQASKQEEEAGELSSGAGVAVPTT
jgi:hypothetical protein